MAAVEPDRFAPLNRMHEATRLVQAAAWQFVIDPDGRSAAMRAMAAERIATWGLSEQ